MAIKAAELQVVIGADLSEASQKIIGFSDEMIGKLSNVGGIITKAVGGAALAGFGLLVGGLTASIQGAMESEKVQAQLAAVLESTGGAAGWTADQANELASSLMQVTGVDDDLIVSAQSLLLTFTNISGEIMPQVTETALDMAQAFGMDASNAAIMLGKALNDPVEGVGALKRVGVSLTAAQEEQIKKFVELGDVASAQKVILQELATEVGGSAKAFGGTFAGQMSLLKASLGNIGEEVGGKLLPVLNDLVQTYIMPLIPKIAELASAFAGQLAVGIQSVVEWIQQAAAWLSENEGIIVGVLAAIGVAVAAFVYTTVIPAAVSVITAIAPIIAIMAVIAGAAYLLYEAWTNNWLGIRDYLTEAWNNIQPILQAVWNWLQTEIPKAIETVKDWWMNQFLPALQQAWDWVQTNALPIAQSLAEFLQGALAASITNVSNIWTNVLLPAINLVWSFISGTLFPIFQAVGNFLSAVFTVVIRVLSAVWQNVLLPAIRTVWSFLQGSIFPLFQAIGNFLSAVFSVALTALAGIWQNVLQPALQVVWEWLAEKLQPVFETLSAFVQDTVIPAISDIASWFGDKLQPAISGVSSVISSVIDWLNSLAEKLRNLDLPDWMTPGSPTPWELGLRGVADALDEVSKKELPRLEAGLRIRSDPVAVAGVPGNTSKLSQVTIVNNYRDTVLDDYQMMRVLRRAEALGLL